MNKQTKDTWLEALRSGKYEQGRGLLHDVVNDTYCCLGVLCEVEEGVVRGPIMRGFRTQYKERGEENDRMVTSLLPTTTRERLEISVEDEVCLMKMNDGGLSSFDTIANWIEKNL